tara:strand:+ start:369 stop:560 length:192 start_codon:yes stop_codon:yes gene_type:complete
MLRRHVDASALRTADHEWLFRFAAEHETELGCLLNQHIHGQGDKVEDLYLDNRPHTGDGCPTP